MPQLIQVGKLFGGTLWFDGALPGGVPPVNLALPTIVGVIQDGTSWTLNVGEWSGDPAMTFEVSIVTVEATPVTLLARQNAADPIGTITGAVGKSVILKVWATDPGGTTLQESAIYGPVIAAGDEFILAWTWAQTAGAVPTTPYAWKLLECTGGVIPADGVFPQATAVGAVTAGWTGTSIGVATISTTGLTDSRRRGRLGVSLSPTQLAFKVAGLTSGQIYKVYVGAGRSLDTNCSFGIFDSAGTSLYALGTIAVDSSPLECMDALGNHNVESSWTAASDLGGLPYEITAPADGIIRINRGAAISPQLNCIAITKKV